MVLTSDCKDGNNQCMSKLIKEIVEVTIDPRISLLPVLPDCPRFENL